MTLLEAIQKRHSVRTYKEKSLPDELIQELQKEISNCNAKGNLHIQLVTEETKAFSGILAHYGKFSGVKNYIALIGCKEKDLEEKVGYYGEHLVLKAQMLGLNTCWVALTYRKGKCPVQISSGEKLVCVIAVGYGITQGVAHKSKPIGSVSKINGEKKNWFLKGMNMAILAPTAMNQQNFIITLHKDGTVEAKSTGGFYSKIDLGIVKYHFECGANQENLQWVSQK